MTQLSNINDLLVQQVRSLFDGEKYMLNIIPKIRGEINERELLSFMEDQYILKKNQLVRLGEVFNLLQIDKEGEKNNGIRSLLHEKRKLLERSNSKLLDYAIISIFIRSIIALQVNGYESSINCTIELEDKRIMRLLRNCLREERGMEKRLARLEAVYIEDITILSVVEQ